MINANGAVSIAPPLTDDWTRLCEHGRELAQLDDRVQWELADLCERVRANGQYGVSRMEEFAKRIDRGRSYVYSRAIFARFYSDPDVRSMISQSEFITFSKCDLLRRFTSDMQVVVEWLTAIEFNTYTYDELHLKLLETFKQITPPPPPIKGSGTRSQLRSVVTELPNGDYEWRITRL